tara:strand:- start:351 stop:983 length:633 start_codon:yes stop_codon:yes gene_type:complete
MQIKRENIEKYGQDEHVFRYAAWAASTAAGASQKCRFKVSKGLRLLEEADLSKLAKGFHYLEDVKDFDIWHDGKCEELTNKAKKILSPTKSGEKPRFTYGVAAKLLNCYLKTIFVTQFIGSLSANEREKVSAIHPPIDRLLLNSIKTNLKQIYAVSEIEEKRKFWRSKDIQSWSLYEARDYKKVIGEIKQIQEKRNQPLWKIEAFWPGHQ